MPVLTRDGEEILGWDTRDSGEVRVRGHHWTTTYNYDGWMWQERNAKEFQTLCDLPECTCREEGWQTAQGEIL